MTVEQIKALPRTAEGIFDLSGMDSNLYKAALQVYPVYAEFETKENGKKGYPDIMAQMRVWNQKANAEFSFDTAADYVAMLYGTIEKISPEIYENYRELVDMFRAAVKRVLAEYYTGEESALDANRGYFAEDVKGTKALELFCETVQKACGAYLLLAEKYGMCF